MGYQIHEFGDWGDSSNKIVVGGGGAGNSSVTNTSGWGGGFSGLTYPTPVYKTSTTIPVTEEILKDAYTSKIKDNVLNESPLMKLLKEQTEKASKAMAENLEQELFYGIKTHTKEKVMSTQDIVRKAVEEKKKNKAAELVDYLTSFFGDGEFVDGDTVGWTAVFPNNDKVYRYSAIKSGNRWYITNRHGDFDDMEMVEIIATLAIDGTVTMAGDDEEL